METPGKIVRRKRPRRRFTPTLEAEAVRPCRIDDRSIAQVAEDLDLTEKTPSEWVHRIRPVNRQVERSLTAGSARRQHRGRWSGRGKIEIVLRILCGEALDGLSRKLGVSPGRLAEWRDEAIECLREAAWATKGDFDDAIAQGTSLRHDDGSQFISRTFRDELHTLGIESSPSFVRQPEGDGCIERFVRTLTDQLLWLRRFGTFAELDAALRDFAQRVRRHWIIRRIGYRTPALHRRELLVEAA
jgi:transposase-like protein